MRTIVLLSALALTACGADGAPVRPKVATTVSVGTGGMSTSTSIAVEQGPVTVGASF